MMWYWCIEGYGELSDVASVVSLVQLMRVEL